MTNFNETQQVESLERVNNQIHFGIVLDWISNSRNFNNELFLNIVRCKKKWSLFSPTMFLTMVIKNISMQCTLDNKIQTAKSENW